MLITTANQEANSNLAMKKRKRLAEMSPEIQSDSDTEKNQANANEKRKLSM